MSSRLMRHLVWTPAGEHPTAARPMLTAVAAGGRAEDLSIDASLGPRDAAIYLLHIGAEVEHLLMVQYLYAGYSVGGPHLSDEESRIAAMWQRTILTIAREEMAHLATVQNLLTVIGGPITFDREDFPAPAELYPFRFTLEPLTKNSLGKYVLAEMPNEATLQALGLTEEIKNIERSIEGGLDAVKVHRVGILYDALYKLFTMPSQDKDPTAKVPPFVASCDISAASLAYQVRPQEWGLDQPDLLIRTAVDRDTAAGAIQVISVQGEGSKIENLPNSHFGRFLEIYRQFPDKWTPAKDVACNPKLDVGEPGDLITNPAACDWAKLFDLRYRLLLMMLSHSFHIQSDARGAVRSPRGLLISWAFGEMYHLRSIAEILMSLPLDDKVSGRFAGPPFLMPYSLALAIHERDRWRGHRDLIRASDELVRQVLTKSGNKRSYLEGMLSANQRALAQIEPLIGD